MIVGGAVGAIVLLGGIVFLMSGGKERPRRDSTPAPSGGMTREEARRIMNEGKVELNSGATLVRQAGAHEFDSPGYAAKMNEARSHLNKAMESFSRIPDNMSNPELDSMSQQCTKLLNMCFKVPVKVR